jgi:hypothetical protein
VRHLRHPAAAAQGPAGRQRARVRPIAHRHRMCLWDAMHTAVRPHPLLLLLLLLPCTRACAATQVRVGRVWRHCAGRGPRVR